MTEHKINEEKMLVRERKASFLLTPHSLHTFPSLLSLTLILCFSHFLSVNPSLSPLSVLHITKAPPVTVAPPPAPNGAAGINAGYI